MTGVDLGFVPVVRTPAVAEQARLRSARAFTSGGVVHLPAELGPMTGVDVEPLLAHELTHVLQQRRIGAEAAEDSPAAAELEAQARRLEHAARGEVPADAAALPDAARVSVSWTPEEGFHHAAAGAATVSAPASVGSPAEPPAAGQVGQRAPLVDPPTGGSPDVAALLRELSAASEPTGSDGGGGDLVYPDLGEPYDGREAQPAEVAVADLSDADVDRIAQRILPSLPGAGAPQLDTADPALLDALAGGLYQRMRSRLRSELMADRERLGLLTEFH